MKPAPFAYAKAKSLDHAIELLARPDGDARLLAGGQSLIATLNMRLSAPKLLVDLNGVSRLAGIAVKNGMVEIGALTRHVEAERSAEIVRHAPLIALAMPHIGHAAIRNRGTLGGSIAFADPAAELPACLVALGGEVEIAGPRGKRTVKAGDFFKGLFETALGAGDVLTAIRIPAATPETRVGFAEFARRHGDYAICGVAVCVTVDEDGALQAGKAALISVGPTPVVVELGQVVAGTHPGGDLSDVHDAVRAAVSPEADIHASAEYRRQLAGVLAVRAVREAAQRAAA